ncbi:MAG: zinc ribbon domain-containing protein [Acidimicrobiales bacterium]
MISCPCGHVLSVDDRFCAKCGLSVAGAAAAKPSSQLGSQPEALTAGEMPAGDNDLLLLSPASVESVETSSVVHSSFPTRWAAAGVLLVAAMMWGLYSWPQSEATSGSEDGAATPGGSDLVPESDLAEAVEDVEGADGQEQASMPEDRSITVEREGDADSTIGNESDSEGDPDDGSASAPVEPLVGELTGFGLAVGSFDRGNAVRLISLDTGDEVELGGVSGHTIGMIGTHLVVSRWDSISTVDLASEERQPVAVHESELGNVNATWINDGKIWTTVDEGDGSPMLVGFSETGEVVERREVLGLNFFFGTPGAGDLVSSDAGGIYRRRGDDYDRLSTGRLRVVGEDIALVDECDDSLRCTSVWYERESWERAELPSPGFAHVSWTAIAGNDRWLATTGLDEDGIELIEVATGEVERTITGQALSGPFLSIPVSDDGRWLFSRTSTGGSVVIDMDSGTEWPIELPITSDAVVGIIDLAGTALDGL